MPTRSGKIKRLSRRNCCGTHTHTIVDVQEMKRLCAYIFLELLQHVARDGPVQEVRILPSHAHPPAPGHLRKDQLGDVLLFSFFFLSCVR
jgi:hypothetical protein